MTIPEWQTVIATIQLLSPAIAGAAVALAVSIRKEIADLRNAHAVTASLAATNAGELVGVNEQIIALQRQAVGATSDAHATALATNTTKPV